MIENRITKTMLGGGRGSVTFDGSTECTYVARMTNQSAIGPKCGVTTNAAMVSAIETPTLKYHCDEKSL